jgi:hypothetical protein
MQLVQDGQTVCSVSGYERRAPEPRDGPALVWFEVPRGVELDLGAIYDLVDSDGKRQSIQLLDFEAVKGLVIAIEADALHARD